MTTRTTDINAAAERVIDLTDWDYPLPLRVGITPSGRVLLYADDGDDSHVSEVSIYAGGGGPAHLAWGELIAQSVNLIGPLLAAGYREAAIKRMLDGYSMDAASIEKANHFAEHTPEVRT